MFKYRLPKQITKFLPMHERCPHCGLNFELEPGFFTGAMYVSYAIIVALLIAVVVAFSVFGVTSPTVYIIGYLSLVFLLLPFIFRVSRLVFIHVFGGIKYEPDTTPHT